MTDYRPDAETSEAQSVADGEESLEALRAHVAALKDQALRYAADAENTRRRAEREINDARAYAISRFAKDLLGVADNLARALEHAPKDASESLVSNLAVGLELTQKELLSAFERNGMKRLDPAPGTKFDPHQHQAVMEQFSDTIPAGAIVRVLQSGYELFGRVIRPVMAVVASRDSRSADGEAPPPQGKDESVSATIPDAG
jgi:molecular chaperone GrpE